MDDLQGQPTDGERDAVAARIRKVASEGRIGETDRDIRLNNVRAAHSRAELDLMRRDLDQLEGSVGVQAPVTPATPDAPYSRFTVSRAGATTPAFSRTVVVRGNKAVGVAVAVVAVVIVFIAGVIAFIAYVSAQVSDVTPRALPPASTASSSPSASASPVDTSADQGPRIAGGYALSVAGIRSFVAAYQQRFGKSLVVDATLYGDYLVVDVPVSGGQGRQAGWLYREGDGWRSFGSVRAVFPGSRPVDLRRLDVGALVRNIARARSASGVEDPTQTYVVIRWITGVSQRPAVNVYASNEFGESGYLATRLDGTVVRAYPFGG